jgi:Tfp pilus assembly protein FimT
MAPLLEDGIINGIKKKQANGFTTVELLLVIFILAVVAVIAAPSINEMMANADFDGTADRLLNDLNYSRHNAINLNTTIQVTFGINGAGAPTYNIIDINNPNVVLRNRVLDRNYAINTGPFNNIIRFSPLGLPMNNAGVPMGGQINIQKRDRIRNYTIFQATGMIR